MGASLSEGHDPFCTIISNFCSQFPEHLYHRMMLERGGERRREARCGGGRRLTDFILRQSKAIKPYGG